MLQQGIQGEASVNVDAWVCVCICTCPKYLLVLGGKEEDNEVKGGREESKRNGNSLVAETTIGIVASVFTTKWAQEEG